MAQELSSENRVAHRVALGEHVPWFRAPLVSGGLFDLHVSAGRWVVLSFLGSLANPRAKEELTQLLNQAALFGEDHLVVGCVLTEQPENAAELTAISSQALFFIADYDGGISRAFGALEMPRSVVLDPLLRAVADIGWDFAAGHAGTVAEP